MLSETDNACEARLHKRLARYLKSSNPFLVYNKIQRKSFDSEFLVDEETMGLLYSFIKSFKEKAAIQVVEFDKQILELLLKIRSEEPELHIMCLSLLQISDLSKIKEMFSYSKIHVIFKRKLKDLFYESVDEDHLSLLIRLLDNDKLVLKNLTPVIKKINEFVDNGVIDKGIFDCCIGLTAVANNCKSILNDSLVSSILAYLIKVLYVPQNYLFIDFKGSKAITGCVKALSNFLLRNFTDKGSIKKLSKGLLKEVVYKIYEYRYSSVYEDAMVVVSMTDIIYPLFELYKAFYDEVDFISIDTFKFNLIEKEKTAKFEDELEKKQINSPFSKNFNNKITVSSLSLDMSNKLKIESIRPFRNHYDSHKQELINDFIVNKYIFLDHFSNFADCFDRIEFFNDLMRIERPNSLFSTLKNLKDRIDWSDLISFACSSENAELFIPFLFDPKFISNPAHETYIEIFIKKQTENENINVLIVHYLKINRFTKYLSRMYLSDIETSSLVSKRKRQLIIEYLNSLERKANKDIIKEEENNEQNGKIIVNIERIKEENTATKHNKTVESVEIIKDYRESEEEEKEINYEEEIEENSDIQCFVEYMIKEIETLHINLIPLLIVLLSRKIRKELVTELVIKLHSLLNTETKQNGSFIAVIAIFCIVYEIEIYNNISIESLLDVQVILLLNEFGNWPEEYQRKIKSKAFDITLSSEVERIKDLKAIYSVERKNELINEVHKISKFLSRKNLIKIK